MPAATTPNEFYPGKRFGFLEILRKVNTKDGVRYKVRCHGVLRSQVKCGKEFNTKAQYLKRKPNPQTHCGCQSYINANPYPYEKVCWQSMHLRCEYEKHVAFKDYGGRGITIDPRWSKHREDGMGFANYLEDMGPAPTRKHTMDRIDNDKGYTKSNCRWATKSQQALNQRRYK